MPTLEQDSNVLDICFCCKYELSLWFSVSAVQNILVSSFFFFFSLTFVEFFDWMDADDVFPRRQLPCTLDPELPVWSPALPGMVCTPSAFLPLSVTHHTLHAFPHSGWIWEEKSQQGLTAALCWLEHGSREQIELNQPPKINLQHLLSNLKFPSPTMCKYMFINLQSWEHSLFWLFPLSHSCAHLEGKVFHLISRTSTEHSAALYSFSPLSNRLHIVLITTKVEIISNCLIRRIHRVVFADSFWVISLLSHSAV